MIGKKDKKDRKKSNDKKEKDVVAAPLVRVSTRNVTLKRTETTPQVANKRSPVVIDIRKSQLTDNKTQTPKTFKEDIKTEIKVEVKDEPKQAKEIKGCFKEA